MQICVFPHGQISEKNSTNDVGDYMDFDMIEDGFLYGTDSEQERSKGYLDLSLVNDSICRKN